MPISALIDLILPSRCAVCDLPGANICQGCGPKLVAMEHRFSRGNIQGLAATYYSDPVGKVLVAFKDKGQTSLVRDFDKLLIPLVKELEYAPKPAYLVPVPSRIENFASRGFQPSLLLANALAKATPGSRVLNCLVFKRKVSDQVGLTALERKQNLENSMALNQKVQFKGCFLVDDVTTTGATLNESWKVLSLAGAIVLGALVIAESRN